MIANGNLRVYHPQRFSCTVTFPIASSTDTDADALSGSCFNIRIDLNLQLLIETCFQNSLLTLDRLYFLGYKDRS